MVKRKFCVYILILVFITNTSCTKKDQEPFSFIQLCDTQLGMGGYEFDIKRFEQAVKQINDIHPDFTVICGDLVHNATDSTYNDFKNILKNLKIPCHLVPGNHDVGNLPNEKSLKYYREVIGKDYFTFQNKGVLFIATNTQLWKVAVPNESEKHNLWFKNTLDSLKKHNTNTPIFVLGHYPLFLITPNEKESYFNLPLQIRNDILMQFKNHNVKAYLSGHTHETIINDFENIQMVSGETTSKNFDERPFGFRLWKVNKDSIYHVFVPLNQNELQRIERE